jgi:hypothetical protein
MSPPQRAPSSARAFSLVELLVAISLLSLIVLGLVAMFVQVQRAFRGALTDSDVLETGRAIMNAVGRELAEMTPAQTANAPRAAATTTNFFVEFPPVGSPLRCLPMLQGLPPLGGGAQVERTNLLQRFFFLTGTNQAWTGIGYQVLPDTNAAGGGTGIGTLYRFCLSTTNRPWYQMPASVLSSNFLYAVEKSYPLFLQGACSVPFASVSRVADGVVHLRLRAFATNGFPISLLPPSFNTGFYYYNPAGGGLTLSSDFFSLTNYFQGRFDFSNPDPNLYCTNSAVPAAVELELGILEPQTYQRYKSIAAANPATAAAYLSNHVAQVHIFRQRIPVRNVDPSAYPN